MNITPTPDRLRSSRLARSTEKLLAGRHRIVGLHVHEANVEAVDFSGEPPAGADWHQVTVIVEPDAPAEEEINLLALANAKEVGVLLKERPLLRKAQVETCQVDLLVVDFDLREIGVVGRVEVQAGRHAKFRVEPEVAVGIVDDSAACVVAVRRSGYIGQHLQIAGRLQLEATQVTRRRKSADVIDAGERGPESPLPCALDVPAR